MSPVADPEPELPAAEELVAYLDGELAPDDCRRVEQRLAADADYRQQLRNLDQAWEALDALPATKADDDFARTTMELATVAAAGEVSAHTAIAAAERQRRVRRWAAVGIAAATIGFAAAWMLIPNGNKTLLANLPVIRQVDLLTQIEDVEFLRGLSTDVSIDRLMNDKEAVQEEMDQLAKTGNSSLEIRRQWVEGLTMDQKAILAAQADRFDELSQSQQDRLRRREGEIRNADDADRLQETLLAYGQWLDRLSPGQQQELREDLQERTTQEQVEHVEQLVRREIAQAAHRLSAEDAENLRHEVLAIADESRERILRRWRNRGDGDRLQRLEGPRGALFIISWQLEDDDRDDRRNQTRERLVRRLSPEAQAHLERLDGRSRWQLRQWIRDSLELKSTPDELERFFASDDLDNQEREWLLSLPAEEMQAQLERLYFGTQLGVRDNKQRWNDFRESVGGPWNPPGEGPPGIRPEGPPRGRDRSGPPPEFNDRGHFDRGPNGPRGPRPGNRRPPGPPRDRPIGPGEPEPI